MKGWRRRGRGEEGEKEDIVSITMLVMLPVESSVRREYQISPGARMSAEGKRERGGRGERFSCRRNAIGAFSLVGAATPRDPGIVDLDDH